MDSERNQNAKKTILDEGKYTHILNEIIQQKYYPDIPDETKFPLKDVDDQSNNFSDANVFQNNEIKLSDSKRGKFLHQNKIKSLKEFFDQFESEDDAAFKKLALKAKIHHESLHPHVYGPNHDKDKIHQQKDSKNSLFFLPEPFISKQDSITKLNLPEYNDKSITSNYKLPAIIPQNTRFTSQFLESQNHLILSRSFGSLNMANGNQIDTNLLSINRRPFYAMLDDPTPTSFRSNELQDLINDEFDINDHINSQNSIRSHGNTKFKIQDSSSNDKLTRNLTSSKNHQNNSFDSISHNRSKGSSNNNNNNNSNTSRNSYQSSKSARSLRISDFSPAAQRMALSHFNISCSPMNSSSHQKTPSTAKSSKRLKANQFFNFDKL